MIFLNTNVSNSPNDNSELTKQLPSESTTDLVLTSEGDLALTPYGDLKLTRGNNNIVNNLFRRLTTPQGGYERFYFNDSGNYLEYDRGWTDPIINNLSAPATGALANWASERLQELASIDPRIKVMSVTNELTLNTVSLKIFYTINDSAIYEGNVVLPN